MGLFGDLDVKSAEDNPWFVPANTYKADVFTVERKDGKSGPGLSIVYKISEGEHAGKTVSEWKNIPQGMETEEDKKAASYLKMRLASLGVPESRMNDVEPDDLTGTAVIVTVKVNGEYSNVNKVELADASSNGAAATPTQAFSGFGS